MPSIEIRGGEKFAVAAAKLRRGEQELPRELQRALVRSAPPLIRAAKASASARLPKQGGLNRVVAGARMRARPRANGIRITADGIEQLKFTNSGKVRHPVHGNLKIWVTQAIPKAKSWFDKPIRERADDIERELVKALDKIARRIA
jgi:hypothetical protein